MLFLVLLFFISTKSAYTNKNKYGLVYNGKERVGDLVGRDTDGDGLEDWVESLYGLDPVKQDTDDDGTLDNLEFAQMTGANPVDGELNLSASEEANLTETDKFSRELFSTLATLNQAGAVDQETIDKLSLSLFNNIQNSSSSGKVFTYSDLKIKSDSATIIGNYNAQLNKIYIEYPLEYNAFDVLQSSMGEDELDSSTLAELDPIINQTNKIILTLQKMDVPQSLADSHLDFLNALQKFSDNLGNIKLYDSDPVLAVGAINQYETISENLGTAASRLTDTIKQRL